MCKNRHLFTALLLFHLHSEFLESGDEQTEIIYIYFPGTKLSACSLIVFPSFSYESHFVLNECTENEQSKMEFTGVVEFTYLIT